MAFYFAVLVATPAGKEGATFGSQNRGAWGGHGVQGCERRFTQCSSEPKGMSLRAKGNVSGASSKKKSGLGPVGSWRARDEPQLWEGTTLQSHFEGNIGGEHDLV